MKLSLNKKYLQISMHVILTLLVIYIIMNISIILSIAISLFLPILAAIFIFWLLDPVVGFFQKKYDKFYSKYLSNIFNRGFLKKFKKNKGSIIRKRMAGTLLTYLCLVIFIVLIIILLFSKFEDESKGDLLKYMTNNILATSNKFNDAFVELEIRFAEYGVLQYISKYIVMFLNLVTGFINESINKIIYSITTMGDEILTFILSLVIAFYFLADKPIILYRYNQLAKLLMPRKLHYHINNFFSCTNKVFYGYIKGQLTGALIMSVLFSGLLIMLKVDFAIIIGIFSGALNLIPFFGAVVGFILAVVSALLSGDTSKAIYTAVGIIFLQQIDSVIIIPKVIGEAVKLRPVLVLISIVIFGKLFGIVGVFFAVPVVATIKLYISKFIQFKIKN